MHAKSTPSLALDVKEKAQVGLRSTSHCPSECYLSPAEGSENAYRLRLDGAESNFDPPK